MWILKLYTLVYIDFLKHWIRIINKIFKINEVIRKKLRDNEDIYFANIRK